VLAISTSRRYGSRGVHGAGVQPVCCDGNSPMPFARGAFRYAMCSTRSYIWTKRQFVLDMLRWLTTARRTRGRAPR
jgi:hypothetical protein